MNVILLTAMIFTVALAYNGQGAFSKGNRRTSNLAPFVLPCEERTSYQRYSEFLQRHILDDYFNYSSLQDWQRYLVKKGLCGRTPVQSFINAAASQVDQICRGGGRQVRGATGGTGNLCISNSVLTVYDVCSNMSGSVCKVSSAKRRQHKVVVACDKVENICRPVHYERYNNQQPGNVVCK